MTDAKLLPEPPLLVLPSLAIAVGLNEAIVLQQIHFRTRGSSDDWWRAPVGDLRAEFPFWSENTIKRALGKLRDAGLVKVRQAGTDRTNHYQVQYGSVQRLNSSPIRAVPSAQSEPIPIGRSSKKNVNGRGGDSAREFSRFDKAMK
jgi:hypothetical protein